MNLIVLVDINQNLLETKNLVDFFQAQQILQTVTNNSTVVFDEKSQIVSCLFPSTKKIFFDSKTKSKFPDFMSPVNASRDFASDYKHLFEKFDTLETDNIFIFGDRFSITLLPYSKKIYVIRVDSENGEQPFPDLLNSQDFEVEQGGEPYLYEGEQAHLSIFKNLALEKYTPYTKQNKFVDK